MNSFTVSITIYDYIPSDQEAKLSVIDDLSLVMGQLLSIGLLLNIICTLIVLPAFAFSARG